MTLHPFDWKTRLLSKLRSNFHQRGLRRQRATQGLTLVELIVATLLTSVVILVAWSGLVSVMNMSQVAEARTARQAEVYKALDFMTNEVRMSRAINETATKKADGATVSVADVVVSSGLDLASLGSYGTVSLYLERPTSEEAPAICPVGGPNAGVAPPSPADYDRIVYDIRPSPGGWLKPRALMRYGRVPMADGSINPCSSPIANDPMADALSATVTPPTCSGVLSGEGGFYACVDGKQTDLYFQSDITKTETKRIGSAVSSRLIEVTAPTLELTVQPVKPKEPKELDFSWVWPKGGTATNYKVHQTINGAGDSIIYQGTNTTISKYKTGFADKGDQLCFVVKAQTGTATVDSNKVCITIPASG
jgi:hypothetical protein